MSPKVTIDWPNAIFDINPGVTEIDVQRDIYSYWKEQLKLTDNSKWPKAFETEGGAILPGGQISPRFFFLQTPWKVRTPIGTDTINVQINLFRADATDPFISGGSRSSINAQISLATVVDGGSSLSAEDINAIVQAFLDAQGPELNVGPLSFPL